MINNTIIYLVLGLTLGLFQWFTSFYFNNNSNLLLTFLTYCGTYGFVFLLLGLIIDFNNNELMNKGEKQ
jgi:hypothetical protein